VRKRILFYIAVALQLGILSAMIARKTYTRACGRRIMLRCAPVDPRSLFRGDYVDLRYDISHPDRRHLKGLRNFYRGQTVYVALAKRGRFWTATGIYPHPPNLSRGELFIKGRAKENGAIEYGIESFFVPEGKGWPIESRGRTQELSAEIALDPFGHAVLIRLFLDGRAVP